MGSVSMRETVAEVFFASAAVSDAPSPAASAVLSRAAFGLYRSAGFIVASQKDKEMGSRARPANWIGSCVYLTMGNRYEG